MQKTIFLLSLLFLAGCGGSAPPKGITQELAQARANWAAQKLRSYTVTVRKVCFCPEEYTRPVTITVREGVAVDAPVHLTAYSTVDKVLNLIETEQKGNPEVLDVSFSPQGWPMTLSVDRSKALADEEYSLTLTNVTPL